jgi:hypothetical protein
MVYMVCSRNQYWVLSSRSAKSWNNIKILMLFHDFHVRPWFRKQRELKIICPFLHTVIYQNASWHDNNCLTLHICYEDICYKHDEPTRGISQKLYMVCSRNQYWVLSSRSAKSWNNIKILMLFHDFHVRPWFVKVHYF